MPQGAIILWNGYISNVPDGFALCDGTNNTPDLRNRFIVGAGVDFGVYTPSGFGNNIMSAGYFPVGQQGGEQGHKLMINELPSHNHISPYISNASEIAPGYAITWPYGLPSYLTDVRDRGSHGYPTAAGLTTSTGGRNGFNVLPSYYSLAYIMKT